MTKKRIKEIEELCEKALIGPWVFDPKNTGLSFDQVWGIYSEPDKDSILVRLTLEHCSIKLREDTVKFIAQSRQIIPELIAEVKKLKESILKEVK